jgi:hypothetical protein
MYFFLHGTAAVASPLAKKCHVHISLAPMEESAAAPQSFPPRLQFWYAQDPFERALDVMAPLVAAIETGNVACLGRLMALKGLAAEGLDRVVCPGSVSYMPLWVHGLTPLMVACRSNHLAAAEMLIAAGANVHCYNHGGESAAHFVKSAAMLRMLPGVQEDLPLCDGFGNTPLHTAAFYGREEVVAWWLTCTDVVADVLVMRNKHGDTPLALAQRENHHGVVALLAEAMASLSSK